MSSARRVKIPECSDGTPAEGQIVGVLVGKAHGFRAKIERRAGENAVSKVPAKAWVAGEKPAEAVMIILVDARGPNCEGSCIGPQWMLAYEMGGSAYLRHGLQSV